MASGPTSPPGPLPQLLRLPNLSPQRQLHIQPHRLPINDGIRKSVAVHVGELDCWLVSKPIEQRFAVAVTNTHNFTQRFFTA